MFNSIIIIIIIIIFGCVAPNFTEIGKSMWTARIEINLHR